MSHLPAVEVLDSDGAIQEAAEKVDPETRVKSKAILGAAGSILPIEARHAGWIRDLNGVSGAPVAFEKGKTKAQILAAVGKAGFIVG